jgi:uncharacterized protein (TIGR02453 family)
MASAFTAFPKATLDFLKGMAATNTREWFEANRDLYETGYVGAARDFAEAMGPRLKQISPGVRYEPRVNGSIGRINRDVRFSRDKRPYKDHLDIWFWHGEKKGWDRPGFYLRVTPKTVFLGSGMHMLQGEMLDAFRRAVVDDKAGKALVRAVDKVRAAGRYEVGGATRRTVPRGLDAAHPRAALLLHEGLHAGVELPAAEATKSGFVERAAGHFAATWPVGKWLLEHVTPG